MADFRIEPGSSRETVCECCGQHSRTVSGFAYRGNDAAAAYLVQWTVAGVDTHGANFDLIVGKWGEEAAPSDRSEVALEFRRTDQGPSFMVVDALGRPAGRSDLVGRALPNLAPLCTGQASGRKPIVHDGAQRGKQRIHRGVLSNRPHNKRSSGPA
jgi:hypothetical protein